MNVEQLLRDTFTEHEHLAPDERSVRAGIDAQLRARPRNSHARPLAMAASVVVVAGAAAGAVALSRSGSSPSPHDRPAPAASHHTASTTHHRPPSISPLTMPFDLDYLPAGTIHWYARRLNDEGAAGTTHPFYGGEYLGDLVTATHRYLIDVNQLGGGLGRPGFKSGAGRPVTIEGRPGIESAHAGGLPGYELYFRDAGSGTTYVNVAQEGQDGGNVTGDAAQLTAWGRRIAAGVTFPGTATVQPTFGLGYLPPGEKVVTFDVEGGDPVVPTTGDGGPTTSYTLARTDRPQERVDVATNIVGVRGTRQGRTVQGHPTRYLDDHGYRTLYVLGAVHGRPVAISSGIESKATLYRIADGLRLPAH